MASYTELTILREEERVLMKIASKLTDQLNRLKVEELTLLSIIRNSQPDIVPLSRHSVVEGTTTSEDSVKLINDKPLLNLEVTYNIQPGASEEEDEDDEDDDDDDQMDTQETRTKDQLMVFLQQMELQGN